MAILRHERNLETSDSSIMLRSQESILNPRPDLAKSMVQGLRICPQTVPDWPSRIGTKSRREKDFRESILPGTQFCICVRLVGKAKSVFPPRTVHHERN